MPEYISPYPLHICRYAKKNICLRPFFTDIDPQQYHCHPIHQLMVDFDNFIDRAEAFQLDEEKASQLWSKTQKTKEQKAKILCTLHTSKNIEEPLPLPLHCTHYHDTLCLHTLPTCQQPCCHFVPL